MISRYRIVRGKRRAGDPLPEGYRQDTRKHTRHVLRPTYELASEFLRRPDDLGFAAFRKAYVELLERRFAEDRTRFDALAELARHKNVYLGCNCPTQKQPHVERCHTLLALRFLARQYPDLDVRT